MHDSGVFVRYTCTCEGASANCLATLQKDRDNDTEDHHTNLTGEPANYQTQPNTIPTKKRNTTKQLLLLETAVVCSMLMTVT